jgi:hypothetical protein
VYSQILKAYISAIAQPRPCPLPLESLPACGRAQNYYYSHGYFTTLWMNSQEKV